jgi:hypothetical protein
LADADFHFHTSVLPAQAYQNCPPPAITIYACQGEGVVAKWAHYMDKSIFITPGDTLLGSALAVKADTDGFRVASTTSGDVPEGKEDTLPLAINWNGRSLVSARKAILTCINAFEHLDTAVIIHETHQDEQPVHELTPVAIEEYLDMAMKSTFFMLKEILARFVRQRSGILALVNYIPEEYTLLPLCAASTAAFRAAADSLSMLYQNENIIINGFDCTRVPPERYSRFILQALAGKAGDVSGKWYRCGPTGRFQKPRASRK